MAVIDTLLGGNIVSVSTPLKLARAEALNTALGSDVATKADIRLLDGKITSEANRLDGKLTMLIWAVGINIATTIAAMITIGALGP
jgi:hypothetical protein